MTTPSPFDKNEPDPLYQDRWTVPAEEQAAPRPDETPLPPVEPPSAGFIVQLFVVPAVIVAVIVGVYLLFGRLASGEADWRQLVTDVKSDNKHVRWRSSLTLAQVLQDDSLRKENGQQLASNPEIAEALTGLLSETLNKTNPTEEESLQLDYMLKAVGLLDVPDKVIPILLSATEGSRDREIRKQALNSLAMISGRAYVEHKHPIDLPILTNRIIEISRESEPVFRHQATYILGTLPGMKPTERLTALLDDGDQMTRINAAIGFARQHSTQGLATLEKLFEEAAGWTLDPTTVSTDEERSQYFERVMMVTNGMLAIQNLTPQLDVATRTRLRELLAHCGDKATDIAVQKQWVTTKAALQP